MLLQRECNQNLVSGLRVTAGVTTITRVYGHAPLVARRRHRDSNPCLRVTAIVSFDEVHRREVNMVLEPANWRRIGADDYRDILRACDQAAGLLTRDDVLVLDTETTDLNGEIIQLAAVDTKGQTVIDTLVKPQSPVTPGAFAVHHISNAQLRGAPSWRDVAPAFERLALGRLLISYNAPFDEAMVRNSYRAVRLTPIPLHWMCAMRLYARYVHIPGRFGDCRWVPLPGGDHSALGDVLATLEVLRLMARDRDRLLGIVKRIQT